MFGISLHVKMGAYPIHGLRHSSSKNITGWYLWVGEYSSADDFFQPVHLSHLLERCPITLPYLGSPAGWRFLIAPDYEDVWKDDSLLQL